MLPHTATQKQLHTQSRRSHFTDEKTKAWGGEPTCLDLAGSSACQAASVVHREAGTNTDPRGGCGSVTLRGAGIKHTQTRALTGTLQTGSQPRTSRLAPAGRQRSSGGKLAGEWPERTRPEGSRRTPPPPPPPARASIHATTPAKSLAFSASRRGPGTPRKGTRGVARATFPGQAKPCASQGPRAVHSPSALSVRPSSRAAWGPEFGCRSWGRD